MPYTVYIYTIHNDMTVTRRYPFEHIITHKLRSFDISPVLLLPGQVRVELTVVPK